MAAVGGSIVELSIDGRIFPVAADADANRDLGGWTNDVQANGDGSARMIKTRKPWSLDGLKIVVDDVRSDQEFLMGVAGKLDFVNITITLASGTVNMGKGTLTDDLKFSTQNSTADITLKGSQTMRKQ